MTTCGMPNFIINTQKKKEKKGITGVTFKYIIYFLLERCICIGVGKTCSSNKLMIWVFHRA